MKVTREMIGAAHDVCLKKGDFVLSADLLERLYSAMYERSQEKAERDELKADAMRYRWLRDNLHNTDALTELYRHADDVPTPEELDAAIDAVIAKGEK